MNDVPERGVIRMLPQPLAKMLFGSAMLAVSIWGTPPVGLIAGVLFSVMFANPFLKSSHSIAKHLLQASVILLGFSMNLPALLHGGMDGALFAAASISATLMLGLSLGKRLGLNRSTTALISVGTAICGGSAIAAVGSVIAVTEAEIGVAIGTVFLLNAVALYLFPPLGHALHLTQSQFGLWSGIAIHDISSVIGAAMSYGDKSLETAAAVKLSRTLWIVPVTLALAMSLAERREKLGRAEGSSGKTRRKVAVPWFIGFFLLASLSRSFVPAIAEIGPAVSRFSHAGMTAVLFLIGASLSPRSVRSLGWRSAILGIALWAFISVGSLVAIHFLKMT